MFIAMLSVPHRPPPLRCIVFHSIHLPHLHSIPSDSYWASVCLATLPDMPCLICDFCPSDQRFAVRLPPDSTSRWTPLSLAIHFPLSRCVRDFHPLDYAHAGRTTKGTATRVAPFPQIAKPILLVRVSEYLETRVA